MERRDIIEYLLADALVPGNATLEELRATHESALAAGSKTKDFRSWLTAAKKARIITTSIELAAVGMPLPEEIGRFLIEAATTLARV